MNETGNRVLSIEYTNQNTVQIKDSQGNLLYLRDSAGTVYEPVSGENLLLTSVLEGGLPSRQSNGLVLPTVGKKPS